MSSLSMLLRLCFTLKSLRKHKQLRGGCPPQPPFPGQASCLWEIPTAPASGTLHTSSSTGGGGIPESVTHFLLSPWRSLP